jgi:hypothetical protein
LHPAYSPPDEEGESGRIAMKPSGLTLSDLPSEIIRMGVARMGFVMLLETHRYTTRTGFQLNIYFALACHGNGALLLAIVVLPISHQ